MFIAFFPDLIVPPFNGIASTRFSYYLYSIFEHLIFGIKKVKQDAMTMPMYKGGGGYGLAFTYRF
jgi:hypothetical protein